MPKGKKVDPEIIEKIKQMEASGLSRAEIGRQTGKHPAQITRWLGKRTQKADTCTQNAAPQDRDTLVGAEGSSQPPADAAPGDVEVHVREE